MGSVNRSVRAIPEVWEYYFGRIERLVISQLRTAARDVFRGYGMARHPSDARALSSPTVPTFPRYANGQRPRLVWRRCFTTAARLRMEFSPNCMPIEGEPVVNKTSRSAFNSTAIDQLLRNLEVTCLIVAGVSTSSCVETTARDAADRGYRVAIIEDASAELDEPSARRNAQTVRRSLGARLDVRRRRWPS